MVTHAIHDCRIIKEASSSHMVRTRIANIEGSAASELAANGRPTAKKANGRVHPRLFDPSVCCNGTALVSFVM